GRRETRQVTSQAHPLRRVGFFPGTIPPMIGGTMSATLTEPIASSPTLTPLTLLSSIVGLRRFTVAEYRKMLDAGILFESDRVELLEGLVVEKGVRNQPHENALRRLQTRLPGRLPKGYFFQGQGAIRLSDGEPEPDGAVIRGDLTDFDERF